MKLINSITVLTLVAAKYVVGKTIFDNLNVFDIIKGVSQNVASKVGAIGVKENTTPNSGNKNSAVTVLRPGSEDDAKRFSKFAAAAYCSIPNIEAWNCTFCQKFPNTEDTVVFENPEAESRVFVTLDNESKNVVVSFRGSPNLKALIQSAIISKQPLFANDNTLQVHSGFKNSLELLSPQYTPVVFNYLKDHPSYALTIVGHSLGGALASLAAIELTSTLRLPWARVRLYTYGAPRFGNADFARWFDTLGFTALRVVNKQDFVPHFPPRPLDFAHINPELFITSKESKLCSAAFLEDPSCSYSVKIFSPLDHSKYWDTEMGANC